MKINNIEFDDFVFSDNTCDRTNDSYNFEDYMKEQQQDSRKGKIKNVFERVAMKNYTCEKCGQEIHKNEYYYQYKPLPTRRHWFTWRNRCIDCKPIYYDEVHLYEDPHADVSQVRIRNDLSLSN